MFRRLLFTSALTLSAFALSGCYEVPPSADQQQRHAQEQLSQASNSSVGMPAIINFFEKRQYKRILEMRDNPNLRSFTYVRAMDGKLKLVCKSIGYPIPGATQYTNPQKLASEYQYPANGTGYTITSSNGYKSIDGVIAQADPNGLFSPATMDATWVLCQNPSNANEIEPVYVENHVEVYLWTMPTD